MTKFCYPHLIQVQHKNFFLQDLLSVYTQELPTYFFTIMGLHVTIEFIIDFETTIDDVN